MDVQVQLNQVVDPEFPRREEQALALKGGGANLYIILPHFSQKLHEIEKNGLKSALRFDRL